MSVSMTNRILVWDLPTRWFAYEGVDLLFLCTGNRPANVITLITIAFFALVMFIFWLGGLGEKGKAHGAAPAPVIAGGSHSEGASTAPSEASPRRDCAGKARARTGVIIGRRLSLASWPNQAPGVRWRRLWRSRRAWRTGQARTRPARRGSCDPGGSPPA